MFCVLCSPMELLADSNQVPARRLSDDELDNLTGKKYSENLLNALRLSTFVGHVRNDTATAASGRTLPGHARPDALQDSIQQNSSAAQVCSQLEQTYVSSYELYSYEYVDSSS